MADLLSVLTSAVRGELDTDLDIERLNDVHVSEKAGWTPDDVIKDFTRQSTEALPVFDTLQNEPYASTQAPYLDSGMPWRDCTTVTGDHEVADRFLDALNLV